MSDIIRGLGKLTDGKFKHAICNRHNKVIGYAHPVVVAELIDEPRIQQRAGKKKCSDIPDLRVETFEKWLHIWPRLQVWKDSLIRIKNLVTVPGHRNIFQTCSVPFRFKSPLIIMAIPVTDKNIQYTGP